MADKKNNQVWEEHKNQTPQQNNDRGSKENITNEQNPGNRLKDGTNDFQNGDQEPTSERSSGMNDQSQGS